MWRIKCNAVAGKVRPMQTQCTYSNIFQCWLTFSCFTDHTVLVIGLFVSSTVRLSLDISPLDVSPPWRFAAGTICLPDVSPLIGRFATWTIRPITFDDLLWWLKALAHQRWWQQWRSSWCQLIAALLIEAIQWRGQDVNHAAFYWVQKLVILRWEIGQYEFPVRDTFHDAVTCHLFTL